MTNVIGWDIGGANLKAARVENGAVVAVAQTVCTPHLGLAHLEKAFGFVRESLGAADRHAVTMTAELSDAFQDRPSGVASIAAICARELWSPDILFYAGSMGFVRKERIAETARAIASANWRASAELVVRGAADALFIDLGSTTTDIVPIRAHEIAAIGEDDASRLACGELVYTGFLRGDPAAGVDRVPYCGHWIPPIAEMFATMADVHRVLGRIPRVDTVETVDGRNKTADASRTRLARLVGRDAKDASSDTWDALARFLARAQIRKIEDAIALIGSRESSARSAPIVGAGVGRGVIADWARREQRAYRDFGEFVPVRPGVAIAAADCAPACAVALLAEKRGDDATSSRPATAPAS